MDDYLNCSILSNIEEQVESGNYQLDPFNMLDVKEIKNIGKFSEAYNDIDIDNLFNETDDFDIDYWEHLVDTKEFILMSDNLKYILLRLAWWFSREIICDQHDYSKDIHHKIDISSIFPLHNKTKFYIYKYTTNPDIYKMVIDLPGEENKLGIKFVNIESL